MTTKEDTINKALQTISTQSQQLIDPISGNIQFSSFNEFCIANNIKNEPLARTTKLSVRTIERARKSLPIRKPMRNKLLKFFPQLNPNLIIEWDSALHHLGNIKAKGTVTRMIEMESVINQLLNITKDLQTQIDKLKEELELLS